LRMAQSKNVRLYSKNNKKKKKGRHGMALDE
jgi:hypothetical protein